MRIIASLWLIILMLQAQGQSVPDMLQIADTLYKTNRFLDAVEFYDKIARIDKNNKMAKYRLGICYKETLQYEEAKKILSELGNTPDHEYRARSLYYYANLLRLDREFKNADSVYSYLIALPDVNPELVELSRKQKEGCALALRQQRANRGFSIREFEDINSKFHDFGAVINPSNQNVVFASTRNRSVTQYEGNQYAGLLPDLVMYEQRRNGRFSSNTNAQNFDKLNSHWGEGSGSFTSDGKSFYFSSCKTEDGSGCKIMVSYLEGNEWTAPVALNKYINEAGSENKQPYITKGGDTLFFSSNRPGGYGGADIWMSLRGTEAESWAPAINMGSVINSPEEEITPYWSSANNCLLFSSDGHVGYGGYDIYLAKGVSFFEPEIYNLGFPFNSTLDDTYFMISDSAGFIATNRDDHKILNIYTFEIGDEALFLSLLISGESLIDSRIVSRFRDVRSLDLVTFRVEDYQGFEFFEPVAREQPKPDLVAQADTIEVDTLKGVIGRQQDLVASNTSQRSWQKTNANKSSSGDAFSVQSGDRSDGRQPTEPDVALGNNQTSEAKDLPSKISEPPNSSIDVAVGKRSDHEEIRYETLYFDYNLYDLRPEARQALVSLVDQLAGKQYQEINILSYADDIGRASYNLDLSRQRGEAVRQFLISRGIPEEKLTVLPRGEISNSEDHWFKRILNRKVEIVIQPFSPFSLTTARTYIVRKENSVANLAKMLGMTEDSLKDLNGLEQDTIKAGSTIRAHEPSSEISISYLVAEDQVSRFKERSGS